MGGIGLIASGTYDLVCRKQNQVHRYSVLMSLRSVTRRATATSMLVAAFLACQGSHSSRAVSCPQQSQATSSPAVSNSSSSALPVARRVDNSSTLPVALPEIPEDSACVIKDQVNPGDHWNLRTRFDAVATMSVKQGTVTGWFLSAEHTVHGARTYVLAQVENKSTLIRAWVTAEDLFVTLRKPLRIDDTAVADSVTKRKLWYESEGSVELEIELWNVLKSRQSLSCDDIGLARRYLATPDFLPPKRGDVVVRAGSRMRMGNRIQDVSGLSQWSHGVSEPEGVLASVHQETTTQLLLSLHTCGGWIYGWVDKTDVLGPPRSMFGSNARCPNTGSGYGITDCGPEKQWACSRAIPIFVQTDTLKDPIGFIKANAQFWFVNEPAEKKGVPVEEATRAVSIDEPPVDLLNEARFVVNAADLEGCIEAKARNRTGAEPFCHPSRPSKSRAPKIRLQ